MAKITRFVGCKIQSRFLECGSMLGWDEGRGVGVRGVVQQSWDKEMPKSRVGGEVGSLEVRRKEIRYSRYWWLFRKLCPGRMMLGFR